MATGRGIQLTRQIGEYLVAAELGRLNLLATTFTGNVPHYDIIASSPEGRSIFVQVKSIQSGSWQFDVRQFAEIDLAGKKQIVKRLRNSPVPDLICVLVQLSGPGRDKFYILKWSDLRRILTNSYKTMLAAHGGMRPRKYDSFHCIVVPSEIERYRDNWKLVLNSKA